MLAWLDPPTLRAEGNDKGECEGAASNESPLANRPPTQLLIAAAWAAGACGHLSSRGVEGAVDALCALREAHAPDPRVLATFCGTPRAAPALDLQQRGVLALALLEEPAETRDAVWLADAGEEPDATAALDAIADRALAAGAAPYLSRAERAELGLGPQGLDGLYPLPGGAGGGAGSAPLLYEAYARTEAPSAAPVVPVAVPVVETQVATIKSGDKGLVSGQASTNSSPQQPTAAAPQLLLNRGGQARKWGPQAASQPPPAAAPSPSPMHPQSPGAKPPTTGPGPRSQSRFVDAAKQQLASSLFGGMPAGATSPAGVARRRVAEAPRSARSPASDLLGGLSSNGPASSSANGAPAPTAKPSALEDLLSLSFESSAPAAPSPAPAQQTNTAAPNLLELGFDSVLTGGAGPSATPSAPIVDPFAAPLAPNEPSPTNGPPGGMNFFGTNGGMAKAKSPEKKSPIADKKPVDPFADLLG
ncbi:hypothetical protein QBZ16_000361 [Prototheca wickerhamii]|uniref:Uncharacterized protein n=1 Tax=Prototheca wickerhamii TaxID=3111 RepID=A0AAD9MN04_PROWI|nr:hypothetical protein QBZ16_000361 [Prototheca wickerhamii]